LISSTDFSFRFARLNEAASRQTLSRVWCQRCV
jgi:hypothetical protein